MDRVGVLVYQGILILMTLVFMLVGLQQTQHNIDKANKTLICVLSIPPDQRTPDTLQKCE